MTRMRQVMTLFHGLLTAEKPPFAMEVHLTDAKGPSGGLADSLSGRQRRHENLGKLSGDEADVKPNVA